MNIEPVYQYIASLNVAFFEGYGIKKYKKALHQSSENLMRRF
jgi:hypothetical protein